MQHVNRITISANVPRDKEDQFVAPYHTNGGSLDHCLVERPPGLSATMSRSGFFFAKLHKEPYKDYHRVKLLKKTQKKIASRSSKLSVFGNFTD